MTQVLLHFSKGTTFQDQYSKVKIMERH